MRIGLFIFLLIPLFLSAQGNDEITKELKQHFELANQYNGLALYGEAIGELEKIIEISRKSNLEEAFIEASIMEAEIFRKTENFDRGISMLESLEETERYPLLHVRKLGRLAALYAENALIDRDVADDSIFKFVNEGIKLALENGFVAEEAGLRNELGFKLSSQGDFEEGLQNLFKSVELFNEVGDEENEMIALVNVLDLYVKSGNFEKFDSLYPILIDRTDDKDWPATKSNLYRIISVPFLGRGDTVKAAHWMSIANGNTADQYKRINSAQMAAFKIIHDTNLYKEDALRKSRDLERQQNRAKELYFLITILILIVVIVALIFFRERRLKQKLNQTVSDLNILNGKYEMLMVESNHRIKNNLQMIISMLEYTKKGAKNQDPRFVRNISNKIKTISALHKHLYLDVHNGLVELDAFFEEVIKHYEAIGLSYTIRKDVGPVQIHGERIVYFGLILNEMLANTMEHGNENISEVVVQVKPLEEGFTFEYVDHSSHPEDSIQGMGIRLIEQLVRRVNGTDYNLNHKTGKFQFNFKSD